MPITYEWQLPNRVLYVQCRDIVGTDDVIEFGAYINTIIDTPDGKLHEIVDVRQLEILRVNPRVIIRECEYFRHENFGSLVLLGTNPYVKFYMSILRQVLPIDLHRVNTLDEAHAKLREIDDSLEG